MKDAKPYKIRFPINGHPEIGFLTVAEYKSYIPFSIQRVFWTYGTPKDIVRGRHAHYHTQMVLISLVGEIHLQVENTSGENYSFQLDQPGIGIYLPPLHWHTMNYSEGAVQLVLASSKFDETDYIRSYEVFKKIKSQA